MQQFQALRANLGGVELEREELHQALTRLRSQLAAQQAELESAATAQATMRACRTCTTLVPHSYLPRPP